MSRIRALGLVGSILMLFGSLGSGAMPVYDPVSRISFLSWLRHGNGPHLALISVYFGLAALALAWLYLGRAVSHGDHGTEVGDLLKTGVLWAVPLLIALPLFSRDLYSYAAQAQLTHAGLDPYQKGPAAIPGPFLDEIAQLWVDTPAPYGPVWLMLGSIIAGIIGHHVVLTVWVMRLLAVVGVVLMAWYLPRLATRVGVDRRRAVWIGILNPLVLIHFIAGAHNDALMLGLLIAGITVALESTRTRGFLIGVALVTLAALVKAPAIIAVGFLAPELTRRWRARHTPATEPANTPRTEPQRLTVHISHWLRLPAVRATSAVMGISLVTFVIATLASGLGIGWVKQLNTPGVVVNWMSVPTAIGMFISNIIELIFGHSDRAGLISACRSIGQVVTVLAVAALWFRAFRKPVLPALALSLLLLVILGPVVQPWYLLWPLALAAVTALSDLAVTMIAGCSVAFAMLVTPQGSGLFGKPLPILATAAAALLATYLVLGRDTATADSELGSGPGLGDVPQAGGFPNRIKPSWTTVATWLPSLVQKQPSARTRPSDADELRDSYNNHSSA